MNDNYIKAYPVFEDAILFSEENEEVAKMKSEYMAKQRELKVKKEFKTWKL